MKLQEQMNTMQYNTNRFTRIYFILTISIMLCACGAHYTHFSTGNTRQQNDKGLVIDSLSDIMSLSYSKSTFFEFKVYLRNTENDTLKVYAEEFIKLFQVGNEFKLVKNFDLNLKEPVRNLLLIFKPHELHSFTFGYRSSRHYRNLEEWRRFIDSIPIVLKLPNHTNEDSPYSCTFFRIIDEPATKEY